MPHSSPHRFLFDNDGHNFVATLTSDLEGDIQELISECPPAVTTYLFCPGAGTYYYPTAIGAVDTRRIKLLEYHGKGIDPMGLALEALRAAGAAGRGRDAWGRGGEASPMGRCRS